MKRNTKSGDRLENNLHNLMLNRIAFYGRTLLEYQLFFWHR